MRWFKICAWTSLADETTFNTISLSDIYIIDNNDHECLRYLYESTFMASLPDPWLFDFFFFLQSTLGTNITREIQKNTQPHDHSNWTRDMSGISHKISHNTNSQLKSQLNSQLNIWHHLISSLSNPITRFVRFHSTICSSIVMMHNIFIIHKCQ